MNNRRHTDNEPEGTISAAHLLQLILRTVERNDRLLHTFRRELHAMSDQSQALLAKVGEVEASNGSLIGLAQALKAKVDEGSGAVAALAASEAAHAATNVDVVAATDRLQAVKAADDTAVAENTPAG